MPWRAAWEQALYGGPDGFYRRPEGPAGHFRTSVHASPLFARAIVTLLSRVDTALGHPDTLDLVDVGSGRGELLIAVAAELPSPLAARVRLTGVDVVPRPAGLPAGVAWSATPPADTVGLLLAHEWLDDVPCEVAEVDDAGTVRRVLVEPADGTERLGEPVTGADAEWLSRWWPLTEPGTRAEIGTTRDTAWAGAVASVRRGAALAVDYGHTAAHRPLFGSLSGFARGAEVDPVPDGTRNVTAHVAMDAVAAAARGPDGGAPVSGDQRTALRALGVHGTRPDRALASTDPAEYLRRLVAAGEGAELTDPTGLGAFHWLLHPVGIPATGLLFENGQR
jgi:SAM-dependent MidA family methyltransferase